MKTNSDATRILALLPLAFCLNGCEVIGGIFKAGIWVGVLAVAVIVGLVFWAVRAFKS